MEADDHLAESLLAQDSLDLHRSNKPRRCALHALRSALRLRFRMQGAVLDTGPRDGTNSIGSAPTCATAARTKAEASEPLACGRLRASARIRRRARGAVTGLSSPPATKRQSACSGRRRELGSSQIAACETWVCGSRQLAPTVMAMLSLTRRRSDSGCRHLCIRQR
jgi:hypothetical protein